MTSDADIERALEDWLEEEAKPMPAHVLESVIADAPRRAQLARAGQFSLGSGRQRFLIASAAAAMMVLLVIVGSTAVERIGSLVGSVPERDANERHWDPFADFLAAPNEANPNPDAYGNVGVWSFMETAGTVPDPSRYRLLPAHQVVDSSAEQWYDPRLLNLLVGRAGAERAMLLHPFGGEDDIRGAVLAWHSPIADAVSVTGHVRVEASCGDGVVLTIDRNADQLDSITLPAGGRDFTVTVEVAEGDSLYFVVEPRADSLCDSTYLQLTIDRRQP